MEAGVPRTEGEKRRSQRPGCSPRGPKCLTQPTCPWEAGEGQSGRQPGAPSWQPPRPQLAFPGVHMSAMPSLTLCCHCPEMLNHFKQGTPKLCSQSCPCCLAPMHPRPTAGDPPSQEHPPVRPLESQLSSEPWGPRPGSAPSGPTCPRSLSDLAGPCPPTLGGGTPGLQFQPDSPL